MEKKDYILTIRKYYAYRKKIPLEEVFCEIIGADNKGNYFYRVKYQEEAKTLNFRVDNPFDNESVKKIKQIIAEAEK